MTTDKIWVGLDLGLRQTSVCVIDDGGAILHEALCPTGAGQIEDEIAAFRKEQIGLISVEAGTEAHIVRKLRDRGYPVAIFEARKASKFLDIRKNKTDTSDAKGLADIARIGRNTVSQVHLKSLECQQMRSQLVMRHKLVQLRVSVEGAVRSRLAMHGLPFTKPYRVGAVKDQVDRQLSLLKADEGIDLFAELEPLVGVCESLRRYLSKLNAELEASARQNPICQLLMQVPGVGPICSLSFFSAIENPDRFCRASDVAAYLGLVPRRYQSGDVSRTLGITKSGNKMTRTHLVTAATVFAVRAPDCALKDWALTLRQRVGSKRSRVALARKLAVVLLTMWKTGSHFELYPSTRKSPVAPQLLPVAGGGGSDSDGSGGMTGSLVDAERADPSIIEA